MAPNPQSKKMNRSGDAAGREGIKENRKGKEGGTGKEERYRMSGTFFSPILATLFKERSIYWYTHAHNTVIIFAAAIIHV